MYEMCCAICGCSLVGGAIGSTAPSALRRRRRVVARNREARERGDADPEAECEVEDQENGEGWHVEDEDHSYDPALVNHDSLRWLSESCCLGTHDYETRLDGDIENYDTGHGDGIVVYPLHRCCLNILARVLTGSGNVAKIDKHVLYDTMEEANIDWEGARRLFLDYGIRANGQKEVWASIPGEEFAVTNPSPTPEVTELLKGFLADGVFGLRPGSHGVMRVPQVRDPFSRLPPELLINIFRLLPGHTLLALLKASWPAFCATRRNGFWRWFLKHDMPWLTELWPLLDEQQQGPEPSYKALYLWLNDITISKYGMNGPFMSLANRRRIWGVCEQLASGYFRQLPSMPLAEPHGGMLKGAICHRMALLAEKQQPDSSWTLHEARFLYSEDEILNKPVILEAYWGESGDLVGLCALLGHQRRTFGLNGAGMSHVTRSAVRIKGNGQIRGFELSVATGDPNRGATTSPRVIAIRVGPNTRLPTSYHP
ncbi:hypothetical protein C8A00DRAFT_11764 [Chaetomidium leptoderma]|uniref:F-box domain-containing protein n=1 Tax=Chaetomidium leptoderma TaxID=669021 RepID=A0AAN6VTL9_9PEZI|nr:hypothetical protein C8A00DRAFT_11764 [Chaetomidium leptoderma]